MPYKDLTPKQKRQRYQAVKAWRARNKDQFNGEARESIRLRRSFQFIKAWPVIVEHYGNKCLHCGSDGPLCFDHVRPLREGGENQLANGQPLCVKCNTFKGTLQQKDKDWRPDHGQWIVGLVKANPWLVIEPAVKRGWHRTAEGRKEMERRQTNRGEIAVPAMG